MLTARPDVVEHVCPACSATHVHRSRHRNAAERIRRRFVKRPAEARGRRDGIDDEVDVADIAKHTLDLRRVSRVGDNTHRPWHVDLEKPDRLLAARDSRDLPAVGRKHGRDHAAEVARSEDEERCHVRSLTAGELRPDRDGPVRLERLETEVADRRHDRGGVIDET